MKTRIAALAALLLTSACANDLTETVTVELGRIPAADAIGLSRDELIDRLGLMQIEEPSVGSAELVGDDVVTTMFGPYLVDGLRCDGGGGPRLGYGRGEDVWGLPPLVFRNDVLVEYLPATRRNENLARQPFLVATCQTYPYTSKQASRDVAAVVVFGPIVAPLAAVTGVARALAEDGVNDALGELKLGAPPPGGIDAYLADLPGRAVLLETEGDEMTVGFLFFKADTHEEEVRMATAKAQFVDGVLTRLEGRNCRLTEGRTFVCSSDY